MRITTESVVVRYPGLNEPALDGVSLEVPSGSFYAILGPNGSGKSTLMKVILGASPPVIGTASLDGRPVEVWDRRERARAVGAVPQNEAIAFPLTTS